MSELHSVLKKIWGYDTFRPPQKEIISSVLQKQDTVALLPTGGGKSLCYQIPALVLEGKTLVITPLIALMIDQVDNLKKRGVKVHALHSGMSRQEIDITMDNFVYGDVKLLYISPERINSPLFFERFKKANVDLVAIDEAHCISQWGYDFRPSYFDITKLRSVKPEVAFLALTATATQIILDDISEKLELKDPTIFRKSYRRENIAFTSIISENKESEIRMILQKLKGSGIIYCRNRKSTVKLSNWLYKKGITSSYYHAGLSSKDRMDTQKEWIENKHRVIVCTNAFGMGIDKADVRWVIHIDVPPSLEEYYQEAGRAGRDGHKSHAISVVSPGDLKAANELFETTYPDIEFVKKTYDKLCSFLHLAVGGGIDETYDFNLIEFIDKYKLRVMKTMNALKILEREGWITLSDGVTNPARIKVLHDRSQVVMSRQKAHLKDKIFAHLLRKYEGLFIDLVKVNIDKVAKEISVTPNDIRKQLVIMDREGILEYIPESDLPRVHFLRDRPHVNSVAIDVNAYKMRKERAQNRLEAMTGYLESDKCRQQFILTYFGEESRDCGSCDVCLGSMQTIMTDSLRNKVNKHLFDKLHQKSIPLQEYLSEYPFNYRRRVITFIREMENEGQLDVHDGIIHGTESLSS